MEPLRISAYTVTSALGCGRRAHLDALQAERTGLRPQAVANCALQTHVGEVAGLDAPLAGESARWDCRNNRLAQLSLAQDEFRDAVGRCRATLGDERIGVFIGTSTSGVQQTELAYRDRDRSSERLPDYFLHRYTQNIFSAADYVRIALGLAGPTLAISTACSSSAKVFASARRAIAAGHCEAAVVGGVDSLCLTTLYGFNSLQLVSAEPCRPADLRRNGISIGEAAGFALLEPGNGELMLLGYGESSDAHHMSAPDPDGRGASAAMRSALRCADLEPRDIDYINLHGTATPANDAAEDRAVREVFGDGVPQSSTKGWTGHTLGAAGIVEAAIALLCIEAGLLPRSLNTREQDPQILGTIVLETRSAPVRRVLSNSFGFGGSNCALVFGGAA
ncbi:MAG TPA: beta-ketoacyl-[acyl-carrier-protein] synthase family protein [Steroidobacteraceae bacterium]|nr:beta-ketoacyl-[acyl-carrier-protein] synthase family protein [Steroidobacteraceae bacterium]